MSKNISGQRDIDIKNNAFQCFALALSLMQVRCNGKIFEKAREHTVVQFTVHSPIPGIIASCGIIQSGVSIRQKEFFTVLAESPKWKIVSRTTAED
jgi:hypothetical protein